MEHLNKGPAPSVADGSGAKAHRQAGTRKHKPIPSAPQELPGESAFRRYVIARARLLYAELDGARADLHLLATALEAKRVTPTRALDAVEAYEARFYGEAGR